MDTWQKCPVCAGDGVKSYGIVTYTTCRVCEGHGIISHITGLPPTAVVKGGPTGVAGPVGISDTISNHTGPTTGTNITYRTDNPSTPTNGSKKS